MSVWEFVYIKACAYEGRKLSDPLKLVKQATCIGTQAPVLCQSSKHSKLLICLSSCKCNVFQHLTLCLQRINQWQCPGKNWIGFQAVEILYATQNQQSVVIHTQHEDSENWKDIEDKIMANKQILWEYRREQTPLQNRQRLHWDGWTTAWKRCLKQVNFWRTKSST